MRDLASVDAPTGRHPRSLSDIIWLREKIVRDSLSNAQAGVKAKDRGVRSQALELDGCGLFATASEVRGNLAPSNAPLNRFFSSRRVFFVRVVRHRNQFLHRIVDACEHELASHQLRHFEDARADAAAGESQSEGVNQLASADFQFGGHAPKALLYGHLRPLAQAL